MGPVRLAHPVPADELGEPNLANIEELEFAHRGRPFRLRIEPGRHAALVFNGVVRKERRYAGREPLYLWTNVELEWEEHHYIEARYWPSSGAVQVTVNGDPLAEWQLDPAELPGGEA